MAETLASACLKVLETASPDEKRAAALRAKSLCDAGVLFGPALQPPARPARPERPPLAAPADMPRRRLGSKQGRAALLHAIAHIEFNAIDLAFDMAMRFAGDVRELGLDQKAFVADWIAVGADEARHFGMINDRLGEIGCAYGDLPAHDGLWEAASNTAENFVARLVVAPLILEARGLDVTPDMINKLIAVGDDRSASILQTIYRDEIGHVECGQRWFHAACLALEENPARTFDGMRRRYFAGVLKPPFNYEARDQAGLKRRYYEPSELF